MVSLRIYSVWLCVFFLPLKTNAQRVICTFQGINDSALKIVLPTDIINKRRAIIKAIWGSDHLPRRSDVIVSVNIVSPLHPEPIIARVDKMEIPSHIPVKQGSVSINNLAYFFVPVNRNGKLMIVHHGHACTFKDAQSGDKGYRMEATIIGFLRAGYDVLAVYMPQASEISCSMDHCGIINTDLGIQNPSGTFGLRLFLEPTIVSLNYLLKKNAYKNVDMMGLSGGGWTTTIIAAIDDRIKFSFPVAGSIPLYLRWGQSIGDVEQFLPGLYRDIASYPDLYILGSYGEGRKQVQILNLYDNCCFGQQQYNPNQNYKTEIHAYAQRVKDRLNDLGAKDHYDLVIDTVAQSHQVSTYALNNIILPGLSSQITK